MMWCYFGRMCRAAAVAFAATFGGLPAQAFVQPKRIQNLLEAQLDQTRPTAHDNLCGLLVDLRGGKTATANKGSKGVSKSKASSKKGVANRKDVKNNKKSKSKGKGGKPSFAATIKAFFVSLINPHFALKLEAKKKNQVHTVHGSASTTGAST